MKSKQNIKPSIYVLIRAWKNFSALKKCILSVNKQKFTNYQILFCDDYSQFSINQIEWLRKQLKKHIAIFNKQRRYSLFNAYQLIHKYALNDKAIIFILDGDDQLANDNALQIVFDFYQKHHSQLTYGSCLIKNNQEENGKINSISEANQTYPKDINLAKIIKLPFFPLHPRTFLVSLFKQIPLKAFLDDYNNWLKFAEDQAMLYPMLQLTNFNYAVIPDILSIYNSATKLSDNKKNLESQIKTEIYLRKKYSTTKTNNYSKTVILKYGQICSIPIIGDLFSNCNFWLLKKQLTNIIYLSAKNPDIIQKKIILYLVNKSINVHLQSLKLSHLFRNYFPKNFILDINKIDSENMYDMLWSAILCEQITPIGKEYLHKIIPQNMPIAKEKLKIVIPYWDDPSAPCDYIYQTIRELSILGHEITILNLFGKYQKSFFTNYSDENIKLKIVNLNKLLTNKFISTRLTNWLNNIFFKLSAIIFFNTNPNQILWCFDPADVSFIKLAKKNNFKIIYDCVDYFSSLNPDIDKRIKENQRKLIANADKVFANSHILFRLNKLDQPKFKDKSLLVVQGFNERDFKNRKPLSTNENNTIQEFKKLKKKYAVTIGFVGSINYRIDYDLLISLIKNNHNYLFAMSDAVLTFASEEPYTNFNNQLKELKKQSNVYMFPRSANKTYLLDMMKLFDMAAIPYNTDYEFNKYCYPMKFFEYLYAGCKIISTPIEELKKYPEYVTIAKTKQEWLAAIKQISTIKNRQDGISFATNNSWSKKISSILEHLE